MTRGVTIAVKKGINMDDVELGEGLAELINIK